MGQFSFSFFVLALKTLYKGTVLFNIYFSENLITLTAEKSASVGYILPKTRMYFVV